VKKAIATNQKPLFGLARPQIDLVIDMSNLAYRAAHRFADLSHKGVPTGHVYGSLSILSSLKRHYAERHDCRLVFAYDGKCTWRNDLLPEYKGTRSSHHSSYILDDVKEIASWLPGLTIRAPDDEADDVIAAHVHSVSKQHVIYSMDRDLWQLARNHIVRIVKATKEPPITIFQISEDFHTINPRMVPLSKAIIGDKSDNIPGVKGFSREDLKLLLTKISTPDVDKLIEAAREADNASRLKPRTLKLLEENADSIKRMLTVATLKRDCKFTSKTNTPNQPALVARLEELACTSLLDKLHIFYGRSL